MDEDAKCLDEHLLWSWEKNVRSGDIHAANEPAVANTAYASWKNKKGERTGMRADSLAHNEMAARLLC